MPTEPTERRIELPPLDVTAEDRELCDGMNHGWDASLYCRERQLLSALAEIQALREWMLWHCDMAAYAETGQSITGCTYVKGKKYPIPTHKGRSK